MGIDRVRPVSSFLRVTFAPAMIALLVSVTVPRIPPVNFCANAGTAIRTSNAAAQSRSRLRVILV